MSVGDAAWENWKPSAMEHYPPKMSDVISWTPLKQFGPGQEKEDLTSDPTRIPSSYVHTQKDQRCGPDQVEQARNHLADQAVEGIKSLQAI